MKRLKFKEMDGYNPFDNHMDYGNTPEANEFKNLWRAVVLQALYDSCAKVMTRKMRTARNRALLWINLNNPEFIEVCQLAGLDPDSVISIKNSEKAKSGHGIKFML